MKKSAPGRETKTSNKQDRNAGQRKYKLKPQTKQKYKPKQVYAEELDDDFSDIDLFGLKEDLPH